MYSLKFSVHSPEHLWLRNRLIARRCELGLSQRAFAEKLGVLYSFVGKVETGDRRLDICEFIAYTLALELDPALILNELKSTFYNQNLT